MGEAVRVLHVLGNTNLGGAESRIMDLYRHTDRNRVQFDFLVHSGEEGFYEKEIRELGGRIFRVPRFRIYNYFSYRKALKEFFQAHHEFALVQGHMTSTAAIYLPIAKKAGVKKTAAHARSAGVDKGLKGTMTRFLRRNLADKADYLFTCSELAGISVYGEKAVREGKTIFIPNAIDCAAFTFDPEKRKKMREELGLADAFIIGHVGRFHYAKNHEYLIRVFAKLCEMSTGAGDAMAEPGAAQKQSGKKQELAAGQKQSEEEQSLAAGQKQSETKLSPSAEQNYHLILLGEGPLMEDTRKLAEELGVADRVHFLGNHKNIADYYQAMDYFVYPSRYEGMPGTIVEAQANGLPCLMSDTICREVIATELVETMSIEEEPKAWAEELQRWAEGLMESGRKTGSGQENRAEYAAKMAAAGFDVQAQAERMMRFYESGRWENE